MWPAEVAVMLLTLALVLTASKTERLIHRASRNWRPNIQRIVRGASTEFADGLWGVRKSGAGPVLLGTVGIWVFYILSMFAWLYAFPDPQMRTVGIVGAAFLRVVSGIAFVIPTPGGVGSYHYFISQALIRIFAVPMTVAIAYATVTHAAFEILTTIIGLAIVLSEGISVSHFREFIRTAQSESNGIPATRES